MPMTLEQIADDILAPLWAGIPAEYKRKYSYSVWQQFEDNIRSAAYTSRLSLFLSRITTRLGISFNERDVKRITDAIAAGGDREVLRALRDDTALLVLMVRAKNVERFGARRGAPIETQSKEESDESSGLRGRGNGDLFN